MQFEDRATSTSGHRYWGLCQKIIQTVKVNLLTTDHEVGTSVEASDDSGLVTYLEMTAEAFSCYTLTLSRGQYCLTGLKGTSTVYVAPKKLILGQHRDKIQAFVSTHVHNAVCKAVWGGELQQHYLSPAALENRGTVRDQESISVLTLDNTISGDLFADEDIL